MVMKTEHKIQHQQSKQMPSSSSSKKKYKGVRMRSWGSWVSEIRAPNQKTRIWLGSYSTPEAAARAYDAALLCLKGPSTNLNFPITSSHYIPHNTIMSPKSIQRVAAAAAVNSFVTPISPPPAPSTSSATSSVSSSPSTQVDDDVFLIQSLVNEPLSVMEHWYSFDSLQSPKFIDQIYNVTPFDPPTTTTIDLYDDAGDIRLWSFC